MELRMDKIGALFTDQPGMHIARETLGLYHTVCGVQIVEVGKEYFNGGLFEITDAAVWTWITNHIRNNQCPGPDYQATMFRAALEEH